MKGAATAQLPHGTRLHGCLATVENPIRTLSELLETPPAIGVIANDPHVVSLRYV